jgi:hypothetical protein
MVYFAPSGSISGSDHGVRKQFLNGKSKRLGRLPFDLGHDISEPRNQPDGPIIYFQPFSTVSMSQVCSRQWNYRELLKDLVGRESMFAIVISC